MRAVLLRHGETDRNTADRFQAQADIPLNETGVRQARAAARALRPDGWAAVYSSPLSRADLTASYAAARLDVPHLRVDGLRERHLGTLDGLHRAEFAERHPDTMRRLLADPGYAPPGGESGHAARARFCAALRDIVVAHQDRAPDRVLVVAHGGVLNLLVRALVGHAGTAPGVLVGTCRAVCLDTDRAPDGGPRVALRRWNVGPAECADPPPPADTAPVPFPFVDLDDLTLKEVTRS